MSKAEPFVIYTITAVGIEDGDFRTRTWGFFQSFEIAKEMAAHNSTNMCEDGYYRWLVVEKLNEGIIANIRPDKNAAWFEYDGKEKCFPIDGSPWEVRAIVRSQVPSGNGNMKFAGID